MDHIPSKKESNIFPLPLKMVEMINQAEIQS